MGGGSGGVRITCSHIGAADKSAKVVPSLVEPWVSQGQIQAGLSWQKLVRGTTWSEVREHELRSAASSQQD